MKKATVLITSFEKRAYLFDAINSVTEQTFKDFDILLVVSKLFSQEEFNAYKPRINVVIDDDAQNKCDLLFNGIQLVKTDIIIFLDDDDLFTKDKVQIITELFQQNESIEFIHNDYLKIFGGNYDKSMEIVDKTHDQLIYTQSIKEALRNDSDSNLSSISIRKNLVLKYLPILKMIDSGDDSFFLYCALDSHKCVINLSKKLTYYRIHASGSTHYSGSFAGYLLRIREKLKSDVKTHQTYLDYFSNNQLASIQGYRVSYYETQQISYKHFFTPWMNKKFVEKMYGHFKWLSYSGKHPPKPIKYFLFFTMLISSRLFVSINYVLSQYRIKRK